MAYVVGLTGGIGAGKSTVLDMLAKRGAIVIDADAIVHTQQRAGQPVFNEMVEAFGAEIVGPDGELDRPKVASIVFDDPEQLKRLQDITHPAVGKEVLRLLSEAGSDDIVVIDIPLLTENTRSERGLREVVVVDVPPETQLDRAIARGSDAEDARKRMAAQATRDDRLKLADRVVDNKGTLDDLEQQVDRLWKELLQAAQRD
jgi:dephospho-CoA kinase